MSVCVLGGEFRRVFGGGAQTFLKGPSIRNEERRMGAATTSLKNLRHGNRKRTCSCLVTGPHNVAIWMRTMEDPSADIPRHGWGREREK